MLKATFDERMGIIHSVSKGMTSPEELEVYVVELRRLRERERARTGRFLHLVDAREGAVASQWASERLTVHTGSDGGMEDRDKTAVVVNGTIMKMQVARLTAHTQYATFTDMAEAVSWLRANND